MDLKIKSPIYLRDNSLRESGFGHYFIEKLILLRWNCIKNKPRANYFWYQSFWLGFVIPVFVVLAGNIIYWEIFKSQQVGFFTYFDISGLSFSSVSKGLIMVLGSVSLVHWNISRLSYKKWLYCNRLYNDALKCDDYDTVQILQAALAIDLIILDLWAHRSFYDFFADIVTDAYKNNYKDKQQLACEICKIENKKVKAENVKKEIEKYLFDLNRSWG